LLASTVTGRRNAARPVINGRANIQGFAMSGLRILFGLDRVPATLTADDVRLPAVIAGRVPLRLNTVPLPVEAWDAGRADHAARMAALRSWLLAGCGDYNAALRRGVTQYLDAVEAHVAQHGDALSAGLAQFHGLYQPTDWCCSAWRPLPRAWWQQDGAWVRAELAFWDGNDVIAMQPKDFASGELPVRFQQFWIGETLPVSPFRRPFPTGPGAVSLTPSSP
jgi:hypothetical protein